MTSIHPVLYLMIPIFHPNCRNIDLEGFFVQHVEFSGIFLYISIINPLSNVLVHELP